MRATRHPQRWWWAMACLSSSPSSTSSAEGWITGRARSSSASLIPECTTQGATSTAPTDRSMADRRFAGRPCKSSPWRPSLGTDAGQKKGPTGHIGRLRGRGCRHQGVGAWAQPRQAESHGGHGRQAHCEGWWFRHCTQIAFCIEIHCWNRITKYLILSGDAPDKLPGTKGAMF